MENIITMDDIETFVLDFLAYRREINKQRTNPQKTYLLTEQPEHKPEPISPPTPSQIPYSIGKGWPHYRDIAKSHPTHVQAQVQVQAPEQGPIIPASQFASKNDIIPTLSPIVTQAISHFGSPTNPKALNHLIYQVIATAMTIPLISESINTTEITPWGRVPLLQAVVELLIMLQMKG